MKTCAICGATAEASAETCAACGEGTFVGTTPVAESAQTDAAPTEESTPVAESVRGRKRR